MSTEVLLEVRAVTKSYRRGPEVVHALHGVDMKVQAGEMVALVGPSGSGKTTLLSVLTGWERIDAGQILWKAREVDEPEGLSWGEVAILPQSMGLIEELTVRENIELPIWLATRADGRTDERLEGLLDDLGLTLQADRAPGEVSMGEQQRAALARGLILSPRLLLADEPTGHQDAEWARAVLRVLHRAAEDGTSSLVATHNPEATLFADRSLAIRDGAVE
jgi:ABC-type lipoprotein export system ATPase subunit